jgi:hypothetical protein
MRKTEKKYWSNGYQVRGKGFWTYTLSVGWLGIMICRPFRNVEIINFYKLIEEAQP